jgi:hypothetical protein
MEVGLLLLSKDMDMQRWMNIMSGIRTGIRTGGNCVFIFGYAPLTQAFGISQQGFWRMGISAFIGISYDGVFHRGWTENNGHKEMVKCLMDGWTVDLCIYDRSKA